MQTDNTTAVQTAIDLACLFAKPLFNSGQSTLARFSIEVALTVFSRAVLTDELDSTLKIEALKSYLSNSNELENYKSDFYMYLAATNFENLKTLFFEKNLTWQRMEQDLPTIAAQWAQSTFGWGVRFAKDVVSTNDPAQKKAVYALLENPPSDFYETFFYGKAVKAVEVSNQIVDSAQHMNQQLLEDIASQRFLSVAQVQEKIQERRNDVKLREDKRSIRLPPGPE